jgi:hypothetical protein
MTSSQSKSKSKEVVEEYVPFDPWNPVLKNSPSLQTSSEQNKYVKAILDICCSDSAFAKKAYDALQYILTGLIPVAPVITSLTPATALQSEVVTVVIAGTGFTEDSWIHHNGTQWVGTFVSPTEMSFQPETATVGPINIYVQNYPHNSNTLVFDVTAPVLLAVNEDAHKKEVHLFEEKKKEEESKKDKK